jgi:hypothetical protein
MWEGKDSAGNKRPKIERERDKDHIYSIAGLDDIYNRIAGSKFDSLWNGKKNEQKIMHKL